MTTSRSPHNLVRALLRQPVDRIPIWLMRQAGRYLPEYQALRKQAGSFLALCKTPSLACQVTLQPVIRFDLDAAILFTDILLLPEAMGGQLHFVDEQGPIFLNPIKNTRDIKNLIIPDPIETLNFVYETITLCKKQLDGRLPLIGFSGSPWTLACYLLQAQSDEKFQTIRKLMYQDPKLLHYLLEKLTQSIILYLNAQIEYGVDCVMLFDTWGGLLSSQTYWDFSAQYLQAITGNLMRTHHDVIIPNIIFSKDTGLWLETTARCGCDAIGIDWHLNLAQARQRLGNQVALQGNLDPVILLTDTQTIQQAVKETLQSWGNEPGLVFNLGHGVLQKTPPENVNTLVNAVHDHS